MERDGKGRDFEVEEGTEVVRRTIVGGRPLARKKRKVRIPIGIEKVLCLAARDAAFRTRLLEQRADALAALGSEMSPAEREVLLSIPAATLTVMIDSIDVRRHSRRRFMRGVLAASALAAMTTGIACDGNWEPKTTGIGPDWPPDTVQETTPDTPKPQEYLAPEVMPDAGVVPAEDAVDIVEELPPVETGILPDMVPQDLLDAADVVEEVPPAPTGILPDAG